MKLEAENVKDIIGLSNMQAVMLFEHIHTNGNDSYFEQIDVVLTGKVSKEIFEQAWRYVASSYDILRTVFRWEEIQMPIQIILKKHEVNISYFDLSGDNKEFIEEQLEQIKLKERQKGFNLASVPFQILLCKINSTVYHMIINNHHILYDGWSNPLLLKSFADAYKNLCINTEMYTKSGTCYKEYIKWQKKRNVQKEQEFWIKYLQGYSFTMKQNDRKYSDTACRKVILPENLKKKLEQFAKRMDIRVSDIFYAAWGLCQMKSSYSSDVVIGTVVSGREISLMDVENIVGLFINTIPIRIKYEQGTTVIECLKQISRDFAGRSEFEQTPLQEVKKWTVKDTAQNLFETVMVIENYPLDLSQINNEFLTLDFCGNNERKTNFDLTIEVTLLEWQEVNFIYKTDAYDDSAVKKMMDCLLDFLEEIMEKYELTVDMFLYPSYPEKMMPELAFDFDLN